MTIAGVPVELVTTLNAALNISMLAALWWAVRSGERRASEAQRQFSEDLRHALDRPQSEADDGST